MAKRITKHISFTNNDEKMVNMCENMVNNTDYPHNSFSELVRHAIKEYDYYQDFKEEYEDKVEEIQ